MEKKKTEIERKGYSLIYYPIMMKISELWRKELKRDISG